MKQNSLKILGVAWGNPWSVHNHSGVPCRLFKEFERLGVLTGTANAKQTRLSDVFRGCVDWHRTFHELAPRRNAIWRFLPENIELLTERFAKLHASLPEHIAILQFGVAGIPSSSKVLIAHVEMSLLTVINSEVYASSYGYDRISEKVINRALEGERMFLDACSLVWTNSTWTAEGIRKQGVPKEKIRIYPPASGMPDPGPIERNWNRCNILFVGKDWHRKGGPLLIDAFRIVRSRIPDAQLTIIGCQPNIKSEGVNILGFLNNQDPQESEIMKKAFQEATIFCMPTLFDTTGMVFMEAALYGLPSVMVGGQGRESIFPSFMAVHLSSTDGRELAHKLIELTKDHRKMSIMGNTARQFVLKHYRWPLIAELLIKDVCSFL
jgi:glycosyltransferase involved in cell wall biosynthesis